VRRGRREEFASFAWAGEVPDPQDEETFRRSRLDRAKLAQAEHAARLRLYRELLALRRTLPALRLGSEVYVSADPGAGWLEVVRRHGSSAALALFNLSLDDVAIAIEHEQRAGWALRLSTDAAEYGGDGHRLPATLAGAGSAVALPPLTAALYVGAPG
jgi:maltooligosyltrehalose trehalohydrolase